MPEGTWNSFKNVGSIVTDPSHVVRLEGYDSELGGYLGGQSIEMIADYYLHRIDDVTIGELDDYYEENGRPDVIIDTDERGELRFEWDEEQEDYFEAEQ